jgi:hypothetical protein
VSRCNATLLSYPSKLAAIDTASRDENMYRLMQWYGAPVVMIGVSLVYFFADTRRPALRERLLVSVHGVAGAALYVGAFVVAWLQPGGYRPYLAWPYFVLLLVPLALIGVALFKFRGNPLIHALQAPNVAALLWSAFVGGMAVTGDWL